MVKNREPEKPAESRSESSEEEESGEELENASSEDVNSQESESEPETEQPQVLNKASTSATQKLTQATKKASTPATQKNVQPQASAKSQQTPSSSEEEESGSESGSESDRAEMNIRSISSTAVGHQKSGPRKPRSKSSAAETVTPTATKRAADDKEREARDPKMAKKKTETPVKKSNDDSKKLLFQRLWSEDDEIAILNGMIEYSSKKKSDPVADLSAFHDFIKKNLHVDVTRTQLQDKIRRLRKKYENNKSKEKDGKDRTFSKPHEQKAYELSKFVWGNEVGKDNGGESGMGSPRANGSAVRKAASKRAAENEESKDSRSAVVVRGEGERLPLGKGVSSAGLSVEERILRAGVELFEVGKGVEGEREWKKLRMDEIELHLKQMEVKVAQSRLVLDVLKSAER